MDDLHLPHTHNDYTIGWVCALPNEQSAAIFMLDERHEDLPNPSGDQNTYILGSIGKHNVVIAGLPLGRVGNNTAATVATRMVSTFPNIRVGLMVGVGGGIPQKTRLGDVVISCPSGTEPGVIQWDMGKTEAGQFIRTGSLAPPPTALLTALTRFKADQITTRTNMLSYLNNLESIPNMPKSFLKSDSLQDVLYDSSCSHIEPDDYRLGHTDEDDCRLCDKSKVIQRSQRESGMIHCGLIASGNQVIKDAILRDTLYEKFNNNILCIEMEAAGLMNDFPCVVIRGISDYSDSHKSKKWQDYAAATAAACAKALLMVVATSEVDKLQRVQVTISPGIIQGAMKLWPSFWRNDKKDIIDPIVTSPKATEVETELLHTSPHEMAKPSDTSPDAKPREITPDEKPRERVPTEASKQTSSDNTSSTQPTLEAWLREAPLFLRTMLQQGDLEAVVEAVVNIICLGLNQLSAPQESENLSRDYAASEDSKFGGHDRDLETRSGSYAGMLPPGRNNSVASQAFTLFSEEYEGHSPEMNHNYGNERHHSNPAPHPARTLSPIQPESRGHSHEQRQTTSNDGNAPSRPQGLLRSTKYRPRTPSPFQNGHDDLVSEQNHGQIRTTAAPSNLHISTKYTGNGYNAVVNGVPYNQLPLSPPESPVSPADPSYSSSMGRVSKSQKNDRRDSLFDQDTENNYFPGNKGVNRQLFAEPEPIDPSEGQRSATPCPNRRSSLIKNTSVYGSSTKNNGMGPGYGNSRFSKPSVINPNKGQRSVAPIPSLRASPMTKNKPTPGPAIRKCDRGLGYSRPCIPKSNTINSNEIERSATPNQGRRPHLFSINNNSVSALETKAPQPHPKAQPIQPNLIKQVQSRGFSSKLPRPISYVPIRQNRSID